MPESGIVLAALSPHPPLLVPDVGRRDIARVRVTQEAMRQLGSQVMASSPEALIFVSPHSLVLRDGVAVLSGKALSGSFKDFGAPDISFGERCDTPLIESIVRQSRDMGVEAFAIDDFTNPRLSHYRRLDHGVMVPLYYLREAGVEAPVVVVGASFLPLVEVYAFGMAVDRAVQELGRRAVFISSGDLSHRLTPDAPAGYSPAGAEFDRTVLKLLEGGDVERIIYLDPDLVEGAGECGFRPIVAMLGAMDGRDFEARVLSYEGPFGVGYGVVLITPGDHDPDREFFRRLKGRRRALVEERRAEESPIVALARRAVEEYVTSGRIIGVPGQLDEVMKRKAGVFCSIKKHGQLRGCIGTVFPTSRNVAEETIRNAIAAATEDPRFEPVRPDELGDLVYSVDVLSSPEPIRSIAELDPKRYGVIVRKGGRTGLLLPDLEGITDARQQVEIAKDKAGIRPEEQVSLERFEVVRYK